LVIHRCCKAVKIASIQSLKELAILVGAEDGQPPELTKMVYMYVEAFFQTI
jgi:hypothetical protein